MSFSELPKCVSNRFTLRFIGAGIILIFGFIFWAILGSFVYGFVFPALLAVYFGVTNYFLLKEVLSKGLFELEGKITRMDRIVNHKRLQRLLTRSDAPFAFWIITQSGLEAKIHPESRRFTLDVGQYVRIYFSQSQHPRESDGKYIFSDYILYEPFSVNDDAAEAEEEQ